MRKCRNTGRICQILFVGPVILKESFLNEASCFETKKILTECQPGCYPQQELFCPAVEPQQETV